MLHRMNAAIAFSVLLMCLLPASLLSQRIVITYYSQTGHTKAMAEAVAKGARSVQGTQIRLLAVDTTSSNDLLWADAIIVGSPVHGANVAAPVTEAMYHWPWPDKLKDKIGAAFVTGGGISAGEELAQLSIIHTLLVYNMIIVGGPTWDQAFGASAITGERPFLDEKNGGIVDPMFLAKGEALGRRVAEVAKGFSADKK
jgi:NAD(P)H dehydrogenase (quinone)